MNDYSVKYYVLHAGSAGIGHRPDPRTAALSILLEPPVALRLEVS
jgi:hypothetical protein